MIEKKRLIVDISGFIMFIVGIILNIIAVCKEFGFWGFISRASIEETKLLFANQSEFIIPGLILAIVGYIIISVIDK